MSPAKSDSTPIIMAARLLVVVVTVAALSLAKEIFIPLALGILLSFLLSPLVNRLQRAGLSNVLAVLTVAVLAFGLLAAGFTLIGRELSNLIADLPQHRHELVSKARSVAGLTTGVGGELDQLASEVAEAMEKETQDDPPPPPTMMQRWTNSLFPLPPAATEEPTNDGTSSTTPLYVQLVEDKFSLAKWATTAGNLLGPLATAGLVSVFTLFMLVHREDLRDRLMTLVSHNNYVTTTEALDEAAQRISRYLLAQSAINLSYGAILTLGLSLIGWLLADEGLFPNALLWGVLAGMLRFVPYVGPILAALFPLSMALSVFTGYSVFAATLTLIVTMELLSNNLFEPWLYGTSSGISAVAVIAAAVFWGWLWGPVGLLLSTPLTVCLVVLGRYLPAFSVFTTLLGEQVEIPTAVRFYQRLLASDYQRAGELLANYAQEHDYESTCDQVLMPTLRKIRRDVNTEYLREADANRLLALLGGLIDDLIQRSEPPLHAEAPDANPINRGELPTVIGCASHHFSEHLILNLLRGAGRGNYQLVNLGDELLPSELAEQASRLQPAAVVLVVLPPGGFAQSRFLSQSMREAGFRGPLIVYAAGKFKYFDRLFVRFRRAGATSVTTTFTQTQHKLHSSVQQPSLPRATATTVEEV